MANSRLPPLLEKVIGQLGDDIRCKYWDLSSNNEDDIFLTVHFCHETEMNYLETLDEYTPLVHLNRKKNLVEKLEEKSKDVDGLETSAEEITPAIGQHDKELVDDHLGTIRRKLSDATERAQRRLLSFQTLIANYDTVITEVETHEQWLNDTQAAVNEEAPVGVSVEQAQEALQAHNAIVHEIETKQGSLDTVRRQGETLLQSMNQKERDIVEGKIKELKENHKRLRETAYEKRKLLTKGVNDREVFQDDLDRIFNWLQEKEKSFDPSTQKIPLKHTDISKSMEGVKTTLSEMKAYGPTVERLLQDGKGILENVDPESKTTVEERLTDLDTRYTQLRTSLEEYINQSQDALANHKELDADLLKLELWLKEAESATSKPVHLDVSVEALAELLKKYQNLNNSAATNEALLSETSARCDTVYPLLSDADQGTLKERLHANRELFSRVTETVQKHLQALDEAHTNKSKFEEDLMELTRVLYMGQESLKQLTRGIGHTLPDADNMLTKTQEIEDQLVDCQPQLTNLQQTMEQLKAQGLGSPSEEVSRITRQYDELTETVGMQKEKLKKAKTLREQYFNNKAELETCLKQCQEQMDAVDVLGVSVPTKLDRYKNITETLQAKESALAGIEDKGQQISIEGNVTDVKAVQEHVGSIKERFIALKEASSKRGSDLNRVIAERQDFEGDVTKALQFLKEKEDQLKSHDQLSMDLQSVDEEFQKISTVRQDVETQLMVILERIEEQKTHYDQLDEAVPLELQDKMDELEELKGPLMEKLKEEEEKLRQARESREQFSATHKSVTEWLKDADQRLKPNYDGIEYESVDEQLEQHKTHFAEEPDIHKKMDVLLDLQEKLAPTLDLNDKATLKETIGNMNQRLTAVSAAAGKHEKVLEDGVQTWKNYQEKLAAVTEVLHEAEGQWQALPHASAPTLEHARDELLSTGEFTTKLAEHGELLTEMNSKGSEVESKACEPTRVNIERMLLNVNERWNALNTQAEDRQTASQETVENWEIYQEKADVLQHVLQNAESLLPSESMQEAPTDMLGEHLEKTKAASVAVVESQPELAALQKAAQTVLVHLPPGEAKHAIQKELIEMQDKYEQLQWKTKEQQRALESEVADREKFVAEVGETVSFLQEAKLRLEEPVMLTADVETVEQALEKQQGLKQDIKVKLAQVQHAVTHLAEKYSELNVQPPSEYTEHVDRLRDTESNLLKTLETKEQELNDAKVARQEFQVNAQVLETWLTGAEEQLNTKMGEVHEAKEKHQELLGDAKIFKPKLATVTVRGEEIKTSLPEETSDDVATRVSEITDRWRQVEKLADTRTAELSEAGELWEKFDDASQFVTGWVQHAHNVAKSEIVWTDMESVETNLNEQRTLVEEAKAHEEKVEELERITTRLDEICEAAMAIQKIEVIKELYHAAQTESVQRLAQLEEAVAEYVEYKSELEAATAWIVQTRESIQVKDNSLSLQEMLDAQEKVVKEIERHEGKVHGILSKHDQIRTVTGDDTPAKASELTGEIGKLKEEAVAKRDELVAALELQQSLDEEAAELHAMIDGAQWKLSAEPVTAASVEALKAQIAEHNALAAQIRSWQSRVDEINQLSAKLKEKTDGLGVKVSVRSIGDISDVESNISDTGVFPTMSQGSSTLRTTMMKREDSGILLSPERTVEFDGGATTAAQDALARLPSSQPLRAGSPMSIRSDDTDLLLGEYAKLLDDRSSEGGKSSSTTQLIVESSATYPLEGGSVGSGESVTTIEAMLAGEPGLTMGTFSNSQSSGTATTDDTLELTSAMVMTRTIETTTLVRSAGDREEVLRSSSQERRGFDTYSSGTLEDAASSVSLDISHLEGDPLDRVDSSRHVTRFTAAQRPTSIHKPLSHSGAQDFISPESGVSDLGTPSAVRLASLDTPGLREHAGLRPIPEIKVGTYYPTSTPEDLAAYRPHHHALTGDLSETESLASDIPASSSHKWLYSPSSSMSRHRPSTPTLDELNSSWYSLQHQVKEKEEELTKALQKRQEHQDTVQHTTAKLDELEKSLEDVDPKTLTTEEIQDKINERQNLKIELQSLEIEMDRIRKQAAEISAESDPEGKAALETSLKMLEERYNRIKHVVEDGEEQLERAARDREVHDKAFTKYKLTMREFKDWLSEAKIVHAGEPMISYDLAYVRQHMQENQNLQGELNERLSQLSDMSVECETLAENEPPQNAESLRLELRNVQEETSKFKLDALEKDARLKDTMKESERKKQELDEYRASVENLQQWIDKTREMTGSPAKAAEASAKLSEHQKQLQQQLGSDLTEHQELLRSVSHQVSVTGHARAPGEGIGSSGEDAEPTRQGVDANWRKLSRQLSEKKVNLQDAIENSRPQAFDGRDMSFYFPYRSSSPEPSGEARAGEIRQSLSELNDCWDQLQDQVDNKEARLERALQFQSLYQETLLNISGWLDDIEQRLFQQPFNKDNDQLLKENDNLNEELNSLAAQLGEMNSASQKLMSEASGESKRLIHQTLKDLHDRVNSMETQIRDRDEELQDKNGKYKNFQDEVRRLQLKLSDTRQQYTSLSNSGSTLDQQLAEHQRLDAILREYEQQLADLQNRGEEMMFRDAKSMLPVEVGALQSHWLELQQQAAERKLELERATSTQSQYERMLQEYSEFLETAQSKLKSEAVSATGPAHLTQQLDAHKIYFEDLENHRSLLDSLAQRVDRATKQRHLQAHSRLTNLTHVVQDKAAIHGHRMERLLHQWRVFTEQFEDMTSWLTRLERQTPERMDEEDTIDELRKKIWDLNTIHRALLDEKATMYQVVDRGRQLLQGVVCPALEAQVSEFAEKWVHINSSTSTELKKLENLVNQWEEFERDYSTFETWLTTAENRVQLLGKLDALEQGNITAVRRKMELFIDFRKEVENQQPTKTKLTTIGNQILRQRPKDPVLQERLDTLEERWLNLVYELPNNEVQLHDAQMELLPSRQALNELMLWLDGIEGMLTEDLGKVLTSGLDVQVMLQKYRGLKIEIANRQLTVDFVNQSANQTSAAVDLSSSFHSDKSDRTDFAEKLGHMNGRYQAVSSDVSERLKRLDMLQLRWEDYDKSVNNLINWFDDQEGKIKKFHKIGHEVSVQQAIKDCKAIEDQMRNKEAEIEHIKQLGGSLVESKSGGSSGMPVVHETVEKLNTRWAALDNQLYQLQNQLEDILSLWDTYNTAQTEVQRHLTETGYTLNRYNVASGDLTQFNALITQIKTLHEEFNTARSRLEEFSDSANQLIKVCETHVGQDINKNVSEAKDRWHKTDCLIEERVRRFEELYRLWEQYEKEYQTAEGWIESREREVNDILLEEDEAGSQEQHLQNSRSLQVAVDRFRDNLNGLGKLSDQLTKSMDNATIIRLTSRETMLNQRLLNMQQALSKHIHHLQAGVAKHGRFMNTYKTVDGFLSDVDNVLGVDDPMKSSDEDVIRGRIGQLKDTTFKFTQRQTDLEHLNHSGFRLSLSDDDSSRLRDLNQRWHNLSSNTTERYKRMQSYLLLQQNFNQKCEEWMSFLAQVEADLAADIAGNYESILQQQHAYDQFQSEMYSRQQILHAIVNEGLQMIRDGAIEDRVDFEHKLTLLDEQWQSVVRRANQRKTIIDNTIAQWQRYRQFIEKLNEKLEEVDRGLDSLSFDKAPLQQIRLILNNCKRITDNLHAYNVDACLHELERLLTGSSYYMETSQKDLNMTEPLYNKVVESGKLIMQTCEVSAGKTIQDDLDGLESHWVNLMEKVDEKRGHLESILGLWARTEDGMEEVLLWLKDIRRSLVNDLPDSYDQLQKELQQCMEFESAFNSYDGKRGQLATQQQQLSTSISAEDMTILQQRLLLLNKQWEEINHQVLLRKQRITDRLEQWNLFSEKYRELGEVLSSMDERVSTSNEYHIEDLLHKLENDYREEMKKIELERDSLTSQGKRLMRASSDIRANDIEFKLSKLNDKWQRLQDKLASRHRKLKETLSAVQQLEQNMRKLRQWLAQIEHKLGSPVMYAEADFMEIQRKLTEQQDIQKDIEKHSTGVASVSNLCEVLLRDTDACPTSVEANAIENAMKSLEKRWRNICALSMERRLKIEETWRLWQRFHDDHNQFVHFLKERGKKLTDPKTDNATFAMLRSELKKFEGFQKKLHESLGNLEDLNKQYRHMAREGRVDAKHKLKNEVESANGEWDKLSSRVAAIIRRLRHMINVKDDFDATREALIIWINDLDAMTRKSGYKDEEISLVMDRLQKAEADYDANHHRVQYIDKAAGYLVQKCEASDAVQIQRDVEDFHSKVDGFKARIEKYKAKLAERAQQETSPLDALDSDVYVPEYDDDLSSLESPDEELLLSAIPLVCLSADEEEERHLEEQRKKEESERQKAAVKAQPSPRPSPRPSSRQTTPRSITAYQWAEEEEEESPTGASGEDEETPDDEDMYEEDSEDSPDEPGGKDTWRAHFHQSGGLRKDKLSRVEGYLTQLEHTMRDLTDQMAESERTLRCSTPVGPDAENAVIQYSQLIDTCHDNIGQIKSIEKSLKKETGLSNIGGAGRQIQGVLHRWQVLQTQAIEKDYRLQGRKDQWKQFKSDLVSMASWLEEAEAVQATQTHIPTDIKQLEMAVRRHREYLLQIENRKPVVLSMNLMSKELLSQQSRESRELWERLSNVNQRWDRVCARSSVWQKELQIALLQCGEFHSTTRDLLLWLEATESELRKLEPVDFGAPWDLIQAKYDKFRELRHDLESAQPRVMSLQETANTLLQTSESEDTRQAKDRLIFITNQLKSLLRMCATYIKRIDELHGGRAEAAPPSLSRMSLDGSEGYQSLRSLAGSRGSTSHSPFITSRPLVASATSSTMFGPDQDIDNIENGLTSDLQTRQRRSRFLSRVCRTALPIQMLMLLLLGVACLVPMTEEDFSCFVANNFKKSFDTMLNYPDGPPPF